MPDEEWIKTLKDGRKVKFIYQELPGRRGVTFRRKTATLSFSTEALIPYLEGRFKRRAQGKGPPP
jgi:hypothetical protein